jgi:hypothetical protein
VRTQAKRERRRDALREDYDPLRREDWNFDLLPNEELIACCFWEYARESRTIKMAADVHWCHVRHIWHRQEYADSPDRKREDDEEAERIERRASAVRFNYDEFFEEFWNTEFPLIKIYDCVVKHVREGALAWQLLPTEARRDLTNQVAEYGILRPIAPATVGELETLWLRNSEWLHDLRQMDRPPYDDSEEAALWDESEPVTQADAAKAGGEVSAALTVDFSRFTDSEITEEFRAWLSEHRPAHCKSPTRVFPGTRQRGKKLIEYRVALERLGMMRLLHWRSPTQLRQEMPEAWKKISAKERDFRREIRKRLASSISCSLSCRRARDRILRSGKVCCFHPC